MISRMDDEDRDEYELEEAEKEVSGRTVEKGASPELRMLWSAIKELREAEDGDDAVALTGEEHALLGDALRPERTERVTLETELAEAVQTARRGVKSSKEKDAAAESLQPLVDAKRAAVESKVDGIMLPVEAPQRRKETRAHGEDDRRHAKRLYREALSQATAGRAAAAGERQAAERGSGDDGDGGNPKKPHGKRPSDHRPSGPSRGGHRSQLRVDSDSRSHSGSDGGSERGEDDSDDDGAGSRGAGPGALVPRRAKSSAKRAGGCAGGCAGEGRVQAQRGWVEGQG
jgi:hypothetical protein